MKKYKIILLLIVTFILCMITNFSYAMEDMEEKQVTKTVIEIEYDYKVQTNTVLAKMISNNELQETKKSWKLSEDKKVYTFEFTTNCTYGTTVVDIYGNVIPIQINVTEIDESPAKVELLYEYKEDTNTVIATMVSNRELQETKKSWKLSEDKKQYSFEFTTNCAYGTTVVDRFGNIIYVDINVTQVDDKPAKVEIIYEYDEINNTVKATMVSDKELQETKKSWKLSEDRKQYSFEFTTNCAYGTTVVDKRGNVIYIDINVTQIDEDAPEIIVDYKYDDNRTVTAYLISNEPLGNTKPKWTLSNDKLVYTAKFYTDQNYSTVVQDIHGNATNVNINFKMRNFTYLQEDDSTITVRYLYKEQKEAMVEIISSVKMVNTKPTWVLSEDGYTYTKVFYGNQIYGTPIQDVNGNVKNVNILVNLFDDYLTGIDVSVHQGVIDWEKVKASGIDFAIIRVGYGQDMVSQDDKYFARNIAECERLGIPYGVYLYSYALNVENALSEVDHVLRLIKGHNPTFGIWYDIEDADKYKQNNGMPSNEMFTDMAIAFCEKIKANGYNYVGIYANLDWFTHKLNSPKLDVYPKWVAQWGNNCTYNKPYQMWQYTEMGSVDGIKGNVDMDIYYKNK